MIHKPDTAIQMDAYSLEMLLLTLEWLEREEHPLPLKATCLGPFLDELAKDLQGIRNNVVHPAAAVDSKNVNKRTFHTDVTLFEESNNISTAKRLKMSPPDYGYSSTLSSIDAVSASGSAGDTLRALDFSAAHTNDGHPGGESFSGIPPSVPSVYDIKTSDFVGELRDGADHHEETDSDVDMQENNVPLPSDKSSFTFDLCGRCAGTGKLVKLTLGKKHEGKNTNIMRWDLTLVFIKVVLLHRLQKRVLSVSVVSSFL